MNQVLHEELRIAPDTDRKELVRAMLPMPYRQSWSKTHARDVAVGMPGFSQLYVRAQAVPKHARLRYNHTRHIKNKNVGRHAVQRVVELTSSGHYLLHS